MEIRKVDYIENIINFVDSVFNEAISLNASDIHFEPQKDYFLIRFRVDGDVYPIYNISNNNKDAILSRIKILGRLKIDENRKPQDGQIVFSHNGGDIDMRVSTFPILYGEKIVIRILKKDTKLLDISSLGLMNFNLELVKKALGLTEGLILVSGPTGSGKTTTLYAMLNSFDPSRHNISTLEDPVEYRLPGINQSQVNPDIGYTFDTGLRTLLRQDPDIVLVGEIRDAETAKLAIEASLTGHLVLGTIHANRGMGVVERLINMGTEPYLVASSLKLIISQRLVKKFCDCAEHKEPDEDEIKLFSSGLGGIFENLKSQMKLKQSKGCAKCMGTGYKGRIAVHELVYVDNDFSKAIVGGAPKEDWEKMMVTKNLLTLYQDGLLKTMFGLTDIKNVLPFKNI